MNSSGSLLSLIAAENAWKEKYYEEKKKKQKNNYIRQ